MKKMIPPTLKKNIPLLIIIAIAAASCSKGNSSVTNNTTTVTYSTNAVVTTYAGNGTQGLENGPAADASFFELTGIAISAAGNVYVADFGNHDYREISSAGAVTTLPVGVGPSVTTDASGNVYVAENNYIVKVTPSLTFDTIPGSALLGSVSRTLTGLALDASGNMYVADGKNDVILKLTSTGVVTILAGKSDTAGYADGTGKSAEFKSPQGISVDGAGNVYVADQGNNRIRKITPAGVVTTLAGSGAATYAGGTGTTAAFNAPSGVAVDAAGDVYVADFDNNMIREISPSGLVTNIAGDKAFGYANGKGNLAMFEAPNALTLDGSGNLYVTDYGNNVIRKITF
jgi:serine/threonine-protein kinase